jgi:hypothetical protein
LQDILQHFDIAILDMAPVFTQVQRDAVGTGLFGLDSRLDRIRVAGSTRLPERGDMIDIDTEQ